MFVRKIRTFNVDEIDYRCGISDGFNILVISKTYCFLEITFASEEKSQHQQTFFIKKPNTKLIHLHQQIRFLARIDRSKVPNQLSH